MDLAAVTAFVQAAELKSFTAAAARLELSASGVSKAVSRLEADVGVRLLNRTTRSLGLTADGAAFLERCRHVLAELDDAREALLSAGSAPRGTLRISMPLAYGRLRIVPRLVELLHRHPDLTIDASVTDRRVDLVEEGFDLSIRIGALPDSSLVARRIDTARFVICASPGYLNRAGRPRDAADLAQHACVGSRSASDGRSLAWQLSGHEGDARKGCAAPRLTVDNGEALIDAALAGAGLIYIHSYMVQELIDAGRLEVVLEADPSQALGVFVLYPPSRQLSPKVRSVVDHLVS